MSDRAGREAALVQRRRRTRVLVLAGTAVGVLLALVLTIWTPFG
ncbi:MAG: hypothetical protein R2719_00360 [Micropruina sp.]